MSATVRTFTAYFGKDKKLHECFAWVESEEQMFSLIKEKFGVERNKIAYRETHLFEGDSTEKKEYSPVPMLIVPVYGEPEKTIKFVE